MSRCRPLVAALLGIGLSAVFELRAATVYEPTTGITLDVRQDGSYSVSSELPSFVFRGSLGRPAADIVTGSGTDPIGAYQEISFRIDDASGRSAVLRAYAGRPVVLFSISWGAESANTEGFPRLVVTPDVPFKSSFQGKWGIYKFDEKGTEGPWAHFDADGNTYLLSAASNFLVSYLSRNPAGEIESRIHPAIKSLPAGFTHDTLLVIASGINRAFDVWGRALTDLQGKTRPANDADPFLRSLGYWTDNGAAYYYDYDPRLGYEGTLLAVRDAFRKAGVPIGYMQLDSWWYPKGETADWNPTPSQWQYGIATYEAHPALFPRGLKAFHEALGLPLFTHARWIDEKSTYRKLYKMSNNVVIDNSYWETVGSYLKDAGVFGYEQDWLDQKATAAYTIDDQNAFFDTMAATFRGRGISMQYCMGTPRHFMQSTKYDNLTSMRLSEDIFSSDRWDQFLYTSRLAASLGVWPWSDVFRSSERDNLLLATLSAGVVGVGDAVDEIVPMNLRMAARADGVLVKPDTPLVPTDRTFLADAQTISKPLVATTATEFGDFRAVYLFAHARDGQTTATFTPAEFGFHGPVFVWNVLANTGALTNASESVQQALPDGRAYDVLVPVGSSRIAFLGDAGKFVTLGRKRIANVTEEKGLLSVSVSFAKGEENVILQGWAPSLPRANASVGKAHLTWDPETGLFRVMVSPGDALSAHVFLRLATHPIPREKN
jgi:hypothetical protein